MPKKSLSIETFSGGVKNAGSGRDMKNEQSYDMVNMNPNSESGSISMAGTGLTTYQIDNSASTKTDVYAGLQSDTNFTIRSGHGLFRFFSDYSGLKNINTVDSTSIEEESVTATETPTEYFFVATSKQSTSGTAGMHINIIENKLDGSNSISSDSNIKIEALDFGTQTPILPSMFYADGGIRIVNGNDSATTPSRYYIIRKIDTDFGFFKERYKNHATEPWESGDSPFVEDWLINEMRTSIEDAWEYTDEDVIVDTPRLAQPKESSAHLGDSYQNNGFNNTSGIMDDGTVLLMINNFKDNDNSNATDRPTIPYQYALRALTGRDIIKVCMTVSTVPGTLDGGAWAFDMVNDKWYVSYVHDNGVESRLTQVRLYFPVGGNNEADFADDHKINRDIQWNPSTTGTEDDNKDPNSHNDPVYFAGLGGHFSPNSAIIDGVGVKFDCMIGNDTLGSSHYVDGNNSADGILSSDGLMQGKSIKKLRVYLRSERGFNSDQIFLMCEVDMERGIRTNGSPQYGPWTQKRLNHSASGGATFANWRTTCPFHNIYKSDIAAGRGKWMTCESNLSAMPIPLETYKILNMIEYDDIVVPSFKTATTLNARTYVGNVRIRGNTYPDRMMKSVVNRFDTFSIDSWIDVVVQDADEIVHLTSIGDKLLQFKRKVLHVINCQEDLEILEASYKFAGVSSSTQVTTTDFGVIWANINGLFFYNGSKIQNLLDDEGQFLLNKNTWRDVVTATTDNEVNIGYNATTKDVIIMRQGSSSSQQSGGFVYNLYKKNIIKLKNKFTNETKSNFVDTYDGNLAYIDESTKLLKVWNPDPSSESIYAGTLLQTRDITFKNPSVRKTITSLYITYKSKFDTYVNIDAIVKKVDSVEETIENLGGTDNYFLPSTTDKWQSVRIKTYYDTAASSEKSLRTKLKNVTSISLIFKRKVGTVPDTFMIDDISISYREKTIR